MSNEAIDKLNALLEKKQKQYASMEGEIASLEMQMRELSSEIVGVRDSIGALSGGPNAANAPAASLTPSLPAIGKYRDTKPTAAVFDVIQTFGNPPGLLVPEILEKLKAEGLKTEAKKLYSVVYAMALRLVAQEKIREGVKNGKRSFMRKQPPN